VLNYFYCSLTQFNLHSLSFEILVLFQKLYAEGRTIIFVTHNPDIANYSSRNIELRDGHIISDTYNEHILSAAEGLAALPANTDE